MNAGTMTLTKPDSIDFSIFNDLEYADEDFESEGSPKATHGDNGSSVEDAGGGNEMERAPEGGGIGDDVVVDGGSGGSAFRIVKTTDNDNFQVRAI